MWESQIETRSFSNREKEATNEKAQRESLRGGVACRSARRDGRVRRIEGEIGIGVDRDDGGGDIRKEGGEEKRDGRPVAVSEENRAGDPHTLPVAVEGSLGPAMDWALREFDKQVVLEVLSGPPDVALTETLGEDDPGPGVAGASYQGEVFPFQVSWQPANLSGQALVRWLLYGAGTDPVRDRQVTLWVRMSD